MQMVMITVPFVTAQWRHVGLITYGGHTQLFMRPVPLLLEPIEQYRGGGLNMRGTCNGHGPCPLVTCAHGCPKLVG